MCSEESYIKISKKLSSLLRHNTKIILDPNGYINIDIILKELKVDLETIKKIVASDNKDRFKLSDDNNFIRANQGHSKDKNVEISKSIDNTSIEAYHGTSIKNSENIMKLGLSRMKRQHIHMVKKKEDVLSKSEVIIIIDVQKARSLGIIFINPENDKKLSYILSSGDSNNIIPTECLSIEYL